MYQMCALLGYDITNDPAKDVDLTMKWQDATFAAPDDVLFRLLHVRPVVNGFCDDISKTKVNQAFSAAFGYDIGVDPQAYSGPCVEKSDDNAQHDGRIISCPVVTRKEGSTYQRLVDNTVDDGRVMDIRVPVVGTSVPFAYLRFRPLERRFRSGNESVRVAPVHEVFSKTEVSGLKEFCRRLRMDYGELDVARDRHDGRIYVVDANNTPFGPPSGIDERDGSWATRVLAATFEAEFRPDARG